MSPEERAQKINDIRRAQQIADIRGAGADPAQPTAAAIGNPDGPSAMRQAGNAIEGFGSGASMGYLPQISGAGEEVAKQVGDLKDKALDGVGLDKMASQDFQLRKQGFDVPETSGYTQGRDAMIKRLDAAQKENPLLYGGSAVAGGIASAAAPGLAASKVLQSGQLLRLGTMGKLAQAFAKAAPMAGSGGKMLQAMGAGKAYGALANPGDKPGVIDPLQLDQRGENSDTGALLGAASQGVAPVLEAGGNALYNGALNKLSAAIGKKGKTGITDDLFAGGITNPKDLAAKTKDLMNQHLDARNAIAQQATDAGAEMDVHNALTEAQAHVNDMKMKAGRDPALLEEVKLAQDKIDSLRVNAAVEPQQVFTPKPEDTTLEMPTESTGRLEQNQVTNRLDAKGKPIVNTKPLKKVTQEPVANNGPVAGDLAPGNTEPFVDPKETLSALDQLKRSDLDKVIGRIRSKQPPVRTQFEPATPAPEPTTVATRKANGDISVDWSKTTGQDTPGSLPQPGEWNTTERLPGPNPIQARALTTKAQSDAGNAAYKEFAKTDNGVKLDKAIAGGFQKGNEAAIEKALGPEAAQKYAEHNATIGRIIDSSKAAETVSDQTARDLNSLTSLPKTDGIIGSGVGTMIGASTHDPTSAVLAALGSVGASKIMRGLNLSQMPVGYAMKKAAPAIQKAIEKNPWLIQGTLNNQIGGPNGEK